MTLFIEFGALFTAYAFPLAVFLNFAKGSPKLVIMMVTGCFMYLMGAILSSIIWVAVPPLYLVPWFMVVISVPCQELFRWFYWKMLKKAEVGLNTLAPEDGSVITRDRVALVAGLGQGLVAGTLPLASVLPALSGPSTIPSLSCPTLSFGMLQAIISGALIICQTFWNVIAADTFEKRSLRRGGLHMDDWRFVFVLLAHWGFSLV
eukprot:UC1_evm2s1481